MTDTPATPPAAEPAPQPAKAGEPQPQQPSVLVPATQAVPRWTRSRIISTLAFSLIGLAGVLVVLYAWELPPFDTPIETTDNALVRGQVTTISPQLSGYVFEVPVQDFKYVHAGDLLVRLDDRIYKQHLDQSLAQLDAQKAALANNQQQRASAEATLLERQAALENTKAQAVKAAADLKRVKQLNADGSLSRRELDSARAAYAAAVAAVAQARAGQDISRQDRQTVTVNRGSLQANVANAEAAVELARIDLSNTRVVAPRDGQLGQVGVRLGAYVNSGAQLMALVPDRLWLIANMKETQMADVRLGQPVTFTVDALDHARLHGHVQRISPATGSEFALLPADNATGNFVKIAQRIPVRISVDAGQEVAQRLRPGMSVVVSIDTSVTEQTRQDGPAANSPDAAREPANE